MVGLLWFDATPSRGLADKVRIASVRYEEKFRHAPMVCYVNPAQAPDGELVVGCVSVLPLKTVLLHHLWLGVEEAKKVV